MQNSPKLIILKDYSSRKPLWLHHVVNRFLEESHAVVWCSSRICISSFRARTDKSMFVVSHGLGSVSRVDRTKLCCLVGHVIASSCYRDSQLPGSIADGIKPERAHSTTLIGAWFSAQY